jgi:hypothetical protein
MPGVVVHVCNPSTWEAEARGSGIQGHLSYTVHLMLVWLHSDNPNKKTKKTPTTLFLNHFYCSSYTSSFNCAHPTLTASILSYLSHASQNINTQTH